MNETVGSQERSRERNCMFYAMNESLFGQSRGQLENLEQEMEIHLNIDFSDCYLILTGLPRQFYMERLGMRRAQLIEQLNLLQSVVAERARELDFAFEVTVLNYDYSKRLCVVISPRREINIPVLAACFGELVEANYRRIAPHKSEETKNITVYSEKIHSYEEYQQSFARLRELYDRAFFLREYDVFGAEQARQERVHTSMVEAERELTAISDLLFLRNGEDAKERLRILLLEQLKRAQDRRLCAEVMVFLKKRLDDLCLILGLSGIQEIGGTLDMERYLCIEELYEAVCGLIFRLLEDCRMPPLRSDGLSVRTARLVREHYYEPLDLTAIAERFHVNPSYLSHLFKREMGVGVTQYITRIRMEQAQRLLKETDLKIAQVAEKVGLSDPRYFNTVFKRHTGMTPAVFREQAGKILTAP